MSDALVPSIVPAPAPPASAAAPIPVALPPRVEPFRFTGAAGEYFGIWIVNLLLTLVTLGLYSPWAKVRRKRYFYGNTWLADANFEYHGNPLAILRGRLLAFFAFVAYTGVTHYWPRAGAAFLLAMLPAVPWLIVRSFAFNAVNSSYRNLRFHFDGTYREALAAMWPFFLLPISTLVLPRVDAAHPPVKPTDMWVLFVPMMLVSLFYPYVIAKMKRLHVARSRFGTTPLSCDLRVGAVYGIYFVAGGLAFVLAGVFGAVFALGALGLGLAHASSMGSGVFMLTLLPFIYILVGSVTLGYTRSRVGNLVFNRSALRGGWQFHSTVGARRLAWIYATNLAAIVFTLGLMIPWAAVRVARYRAECLSLRGEGSLDGFIADATRQVAATGEEMGEMFDLDLSL